METVCQTSQPMDLFIPPQMIKQSKPKTKISTKGSHNKLPTGTYDSYLSLT